MAFSSACHRHILLSSRRLRCFRLRYSTRCLESGALRSKSFDSCGPRPRRIICQLSRQAERCGYASELVFTCNRSQSREPGWHSAACCLPPWRLCGWTCGVALFRCLLQCCGLWSRWAAMRTHAGDRCGGQVWATARLARRRPTAAAPRPAPAAATALHDRYGQQGLARERQGAVHDQTSRPFRRKLTFRRPRWACSPACGCVGGRRRHTRARRWHSTRPASSATCSREPRARNPLL